MNSPFDLLADPELVIGLVAPIGADLNIVQTALSKALSEMGYQSHEFKLTELMREITIEKSIAGSPYIQSYKDKIAYANDLRKELGDEALAALSIVAIRKFRHDANKLQSSSDETDLHAPLKRKAYIIRQLKRPEEVMLLRRVYGRQFVLISAYASPNVRLKAITEQELRSSSGLTDRTTAENSASQLVAQDSKETRDEHGQNVRDAFPLADIIVDASRSDVCDKQVNRFVHLLFGSNKISPTHDEYGMYAAKSAALRTADLSRQVGAAVFAQSGEIVSLGSNEVPKSGGGTYWSDDADDARDYKKGYDPNDQRQREILVDLLGRLVSGKHLSHELLSLKDAPIIADLLLSKSEEKSVKNAMLMDILEFGRIVHAEMSALMDAARKGAPIRNATLYCTTFPCHICAKHIVASGVSKVIYLEPYQKSYASELHSDSISVDTEDPKRVWFKTFIGISPFRYRDLFERSKKRKDKKGNFQEWCEGNPQPNLQIYDPVYRDAETRVAAAFEKQLEDFRKRMARPVQLELPQSLTGKG